MTRGVPPPGPSSKSHPPEEHNMSREMKVMHLFSKAAVTGPGLATPHDRVSCTGSPPVGETSSSSRPLNGIAASSPHHTPSTTRPAAPVQLHQSPQLPHGPCHDDIRPSRSTILDQFSTDVDVSARIHVLRPRVVPHLPLHGTLVMHGAVRSTPRASAFASTVDRHPRRHRRRRRCCHSPILLRPYPAVSSSQLRMTSHHGPARIGTGLSENSFESHRVSTIRIEVEWMSRRDDSIENVCSHNDERRGE